MKLYRTRGGVVAEEGGRAAVLAATWDDLFRAADPGALAREQHARGAAIALDEGAVLAPVTTQEVWAAGVTYYRSRDARIEESRDAAGGDFYARVYEADRPELFFKSSAHRVVGPGGRVRVRADSRWNVPEPELTLAVNAAGRIFGVTVGNDMSSRDIEGENPLYLPQAKVYDGSCALGPCLLIGDPPGPDTTIRLEIARAGRAAFAGETTLAQLKRRPAELVAYLFRDQTFPSGVFLMTGTGIVPGTDFTLAVGDEIRIEIAGVGRLVNTVGA
ncbi:MAG TPA: fumarylacetoacetate hydrolase family protein [Polyangia bacterium]|jgi:2-dehydro-3-deoxy-D-arabinonate dehydratase|nr:fumarylacetoacetate hydrolase family protein [Polyangia bacterium]